MRSVAMEAKLSEDETTTGELKRRSPAEISGWLINHVSKILHLNPEDIDVNKPFSYLGIKSKVAVSTTAALGAWLGRDLPATLAFDYPSISMMSTALSGERARRIALENVGSFGDLHFDDTESRGKGTEELALCEKESIAVIGMACRLPGGCDSPEAFHDFLMNGGDAVKKVPGDRWDSDTLFDSDIQAPGKMVTRWGGFVEGVDQFDAGFFGISPREAESMDPQQRFAMEVSWEALENAGEASERLSGGNTGVFLGISGSDYGRRLFNDPSRLDLYSGTGSASSMVANRISFFLGLRGPSMAVDTACSSSLVALDLAVSSLKNGGCDMALAGGVNLILSPEMTIIFSKAGLMAPDGRCKTFDSSADGYVRSEGCAVIVLKRYADAVRDGNNVMALIRGTHVNQDGKSNGLTVPNGLAQMSLIRNALADAGVAPSDIDYVEAHGTGTAIGDPIEMNSLAGVMGRGRSSDNPLIVGSVKSNIGHLEQAAGIVGVIKVIQSMVHGTIPPNLHFKTPNPLISLDRIPAVVPTVPTPWPSKNSSPRMAGVSGFSFGGVNVHIVLQEAPSENAAARSLQGKTGDTVRLMTLSAMSNSALKELATNYGDYLEKKPDLDMGRVCYTTHTGRFHFPHRLSILGRSPEEFSRRLKAFTEDPHRSGVLHGHVRQPSGPEVVFLFTGQGSQYHGMGKALYYSQPVFKATLDRCDKILAPLLDRPLLSVIFGEDGDLLNETAYTQPALFALEYALARMWQAWGIRPSAVMGHSVGEYTAACVAGVFELEDALKLIATRGRLIQALPGGGKMAAVFGNPDKVSRFLSAGDGRTVSMAALNGPENVVISGAAADVDHILEQLTRKGIRSTQLIVSHGFHSPLMDSMLDAFEKVATGFTFSAPEIPIVSNLTGELAGDAICKPAYWREHTRNPVLFEKGLRFLTKSGFRLMLEIGPQPILSGMARGFVEQDTAVFLPSLRRTVDSEWRTILETMGELYAQGVNIDWNEFHRFHAERIETLPTYPFQRRRYWYGAADGPNEQSRGAKVALSKRSSLNASWGYSREEGFHPHGGHRLETPLDETIYAYECRADSSFAYDHRVSGHALLSGSTLLSMVLSAAAGISEGKSVRVEDLLMKEPLCIPDSESALIQVVFYPEDEQGRLFRIHSTLKRRSGESCKWEENACGRIRNAPGLKITPRDGRLSVQRIEGRCREKIDPDDFYRFLWDTGLELKDMFRCLRNIRWRSGEALAEIKGLDERELLQDVFFSPDLIESCVQLGFTCFEAESVNGYMFCGCDRFTFYGNAPGKRYGHMKIREKDPDKGLVCFDYRLFTEQGQIIAGAEGARLKRAPMEALQEEIARSRDGIGGHCRSDAPKASEILEKLQGLEPEEQRNLLTAHIQGHLSEVLWLPQDEPVDPERSLMELGLDSLMVLEIRRRLGVDFGVEPVMTDFLRGASVLRLAEIVLLQLASPHMERSGPSVPDLPKIVPDSEKQMEPFALTDVQHAYWIGRNGRFDLGDVACHVYPEVEIRDLDLKRLEKAVTRLVGRHEMLRAVIMPDGRQKVLRQTSPYRIAFQDLRGLSAGELRARLRELRDAMSHQVLPSETGPLFEIRASLLDGGITRLHISFDLLIGDGWSFNILIRDLYAYYLDPEVQLPPLTLSFRDYVLAEQRIKSTAVHAISLEYWRRQIEELPPAPELPLSKSPAEIAPHRFARLKSRLEKGAWARLKKRAGRAGLTPSGVLLAAFAEVLGAWSKNPTFTVNLTMFNRLPLHPEVMEIVGDFTSLILLAVDNSLGYNFRERAVNIQERLWSNLEHRFVSGVEVLREMARKNGTTVEFPVVFTSLLPYNGANDNNTAVSLPEEISSEVVYCISQTPQVWMDHQVYEQDGVLAYNWDVVEGLFPEGMLAEMFEAYGRFLRELDDEGAWNSDRRGFIPDASAKIRASVNATGFAVSSEMLHTLFSGRASRQPDHPAVICSDRTLAYGELACRAGLIGSLLRDAGARPNTLVAVVMEKGWEQVAAVLGVLYSGAAYLPIDPELPGERIVYLLNDGQATLILTQSRLEEAIEWPEEAKRFHVDTMAPGAEATGSFTPVQTPDDLAYVIYTSGSTGFPKGVMIDHRGAVNTVLDINRRFELGPQDRVMAVSNLNFDLSVYDIFGTLAAGGTIVMPDARGRKDPSHWMRIMGAHGVTVWNSVPALMQMLLEYASGKSESVAGALRLVLLSGDWIPLDFPGRIRASAPDARVVGLGGATEASVWSCLYPVRVVDPQWKSIPYGRPMANQSFHVLNVFMEDCPDQVPGQLHIGGIGLARGYWRDEKKTGESFITHPRTGERLYRTGDMGRFLPDGEIEFLGRMDFQVKINGYRIELGEIEAVLDRHPGVRKSVVTAIPMPGGGGRIAAYLVPERDGSSSLFETVRAGAKERKKLFDAMLEEGRRQAQTGPREIDPASYAEYRTQMEGLSLYYMCRALEAVGLFTNTGQRCRTEELTTRWGIQPRFGKLVREWFKIMVEEGMLKEDSRGVYILERPFPENPPEITHREIAGEASSLEVYVLNLSRYLAQGGKYHGDILKGEIDPLSLFFSDEPPLSPEELIKLLPGVAHRNRIFLEMMKLAPGWASPSRPLRILEVGARALDNTAAMLSVLSPEQTVYTLTDTSAFFTNRARDRFKAHPFVEHGLLEIDKNPLDQGYDANSYDVIIASDSLHRTLHVEKSLGSIRSLLSPGGFLFLLETTRNSRLQKISTDFLSEAFGHFEDSRQKKGVPLLPVRAWKEALKAEGFGAVDVFPGVDDPADVLGQHILVARAPCSVKRFKPLEAARFLERKLPAYMLPSDYMVLEELPLTANGKVDRKSLPSPYGAEAHEPERALVAPMNPVETALVEIWGEILDVEKISTHDSFFQLGGDSLLGIQLVTRVRDRFGVEFTMRSLFAAPSIAAVAENIQELMAAATDGKDSAGLLPRIVPDPDCKNEPFPLTDVQQAYWIGRSGIFELGNVSTHCYFEMEGEGLYIEQVEAAWNRLIDHHGMMRAVVLPDGQSQVILERVDPYRIRITDLQEMDGETVVSELGRIRDEMSHQVLSTDRWPLFDVRASLFGAGRVRLHVSFDNLIFDGWSMLHLLREWARLYESPQAVLTPLGVSFRDYVLAVEKTKSSTLYRRDMDYWLERLPDLPPAPELPLARNPGSIQRQRFKRLDFRLDGETWERLKRRAALSDLTPSGILLAAYSEVLGLWSKSSRFTINLTLFNRLPLHDRVNDIVGDFTSLTLLVVDRASGRTFMERAANLQKQLWRDLDHPHVGGVTVLRELTRLRRQPFEAPMPVVFTSALGVESMDETVSGMGNGIGQLIYNITQTPQVWLDHQVMEQNGDLLLIWDAVAGLFPGGLLESMFQTYCKLLKHLAKGAEDQGRAPIRLLPAEQLKRRAEANATDAEISRELLHTLFSAQVSRRPDAPAVISSGKTLSYVELSLRAAGVGHALQKAGALPNTLVAVVMEKGWEQVVAVLGILNSGAAYLPIDAAVPADRLHHLLTAGRVKIVLTQSRLRKTTAWPEGIRCFSVDEMAPAQGDLHLSDPLQKPEDLAYVIYTSGSTGLPKGVMIDHRGAVNTILDMITRFGIGPDDRVFALSNLNFDLSVFDVFGSLGAGGTIVIPDASATKDPAHWLRLMGATKTTVWNSVPALMQMLVAYGSGESVEPLKNMRLVLLSGDRIPLDLPDRIKAMNPGVKVVSLGGATEASIWSILYPIESVDPGWKSIPYGKAMVNQRMLVLNETMEDCPDLVTGQIYIGGTGVALGYWDDREKTEKRFIINPHTGERLYRTGDLGRFLPDGNIEFLGRDDFQVKIRGHRIELGEIEAVLKPHPAVEDAVVTLMEDKGGEKRLVGYVLASGDTKPEPAELQRFLGKKLPDYMVPSVFMVLDRFPLTPNGKVDRKVLPRPTDTGPASGDAHVAPQSDMERIIAGVFKELLNLEQVGIYDNFFEIGANSLTLVQARGKLKDALKREIFVLDLFEHTSIDTLARFLDKGRAQAFPARSVKRRGGIRNSSRKNRVKVHRENTNK